MLNTAKNLAIEDIVKMLQEEEVIVPKRFKEKILASAMQHYGGKLPPAKAIQAVIKICKYWEKYCLNQNEFSKLVCSEICTMARIHTAVIYSNRPGNKGYLGNFCKLKEEIQLPTHVVTVATLQGASLIQERYGHPLRPMKV